MKVLATLIVCSFALLASISHANEMPAAPEGGLLHYRVFPCIDQVSKLKVTCVQSKDTQDNHYMTLMLGEEIVEIRLVKADGYEVIWKHETFGTF